jgi:Glyoxalase/Bleomycin resistance protein/Dioxygenase superfamily
MHAVTKTVLDHVAVGTRTLADGWDLFGGLLGGTWVYGGDSPGFWWGQLEFRSGPKIELLTPSGGPDSAFLERFLTGRGPGPHHFNFIVPDIGAALSRVTALGIEPVQVNLQNASWKEAFLHPKSAYGVVVQVAEQSGPPPELAPPAGLPASGPACALALVVQHVNDLDGAIRLFAEALEGEVVSREDTADASAAELTWPNGARLRLVQAIVAADGGDGRGVGRLDFSRASGPFSAAEISQAAELSQRLGVSLQLGD